MSLLIFGPAPTLPQRILLPAAADREATVINAGPHAGSRARALITRSAMSKGRGKAALTVRWWASPCRPSQRATASARALLRVDVSGSMQAWSPVEHVEGVLAQVRSAAEIAALEIASAALHQPLNISG
jgi:hypothetical protein